MSTQIHGLGLNELKPKYDLALSRSKEGLWTGSQTYYCRYVDHANEPVVEKLKKETPITDLDPSIPIKYEFITLESHNINHRAGGITEIRCTFRGASDNDGFGSGTTQRSVSYSYRGVMTQGSILTHPNYLAEVTFHFQRDAIAAYYNDEATLIKDGSTYYIYRKTDDYQYGNYGITSVNALKWIDKIARGVRTYDKPMIEWTVTETNKGGMTSSELNEFGRKVDNPPGDPEKPSWAAGSVGWWHFSDLSEDKDENSSVYSRTYTLRDDVLDPDIYDY